MRKISRRVFIATGTAALAVACAQQNQTTETQEEGEINLYSSRHYNTDNRLYEKFTESTGIKVNLIEDKADQLIERIQSEGENSPADILITVDAGRLWRATEAGIFTPIDSEILKERIPAYLRDTENRWFSFSKRLRVIMYNKERVNRNQLSTYEDLADRKWRGKILMRSSNSTYNQSLVASMIEANGLDATQRWCKGFVANFARPPQGNDRAQIEGVAAGVGDLTLANTYYLPRYARSDDPAKNAIFNTVGVFFPNQNNRGAHVNVSGGGVVKTAPNKAGAIKFLEYLTSREAQEFFALGNDEYPVVAETKVDRYLEEFGAFKEDNINVAVYGAGLAEAVKVMDRAGWK